MGLREVKGVGGEKTIDDIPFALPIANHSMFEHSVWRYNEEAWSKFFYFVLSLTRFTFPQELLRDDFLAMSPLSV